MAIEKVRNHGATQSSSGKGYSTELAFLRLGDILCEIAASSEKCVNMRSLDDEGGNVEGNSENHKPAALATLLKATVRR